MTTTTREHIAIDLLAQAEHDEAAQAILITDSGALADAVAGAVDADPAHPAPRRHRRGKLGEHTAPSSWCATGTRRRTWSTASRPSICN